MKTKFKKRLFFFLMGLTAIVYFFYFQNNSLLTTEYEIRSENIPNAFNGYTIVQLSDLHSKLFGDNQSNLVNRIEKVQPDVIVFTGDLVDAKKYDEQNSLLLMERLVQIAPVYFVTGNHEWWSGRFDSLEGKLNNLGVLVLRNTVVEVTNGNDTIQIIGVDDPANANHSNTDQATIEDEISNLIRGSNKNNRFSILLSHRPELLSVYSQFNFDLVLTGHAHGGQVRFPLIGGVISPNQGFLPKYDSGQFTLDNTMMIVNRGLGNSIIPFRIFNRPEIVVVTLK